LQEVPGHRKLETTMLYLRVYFHEDEFGA